MEMMGACMCGEVQITADRLPRFIHDCNCRVCRTSGAAWGYYPSAAVAVEGPTSSYTRSDTADPTTIFRSCPRCGSATHFVLTKAFSEKNPDIDLIGVNMRLFDPKSLIGVDVRFPDGEAWSGQGPFSYRRAGFTISEAFPW